MATIEGMVGRKQSRWGGRREGAGRKPELEDPVSFTLEIEARDLDALRALAEEKGASASRLLRDALKAYLARRGMR